MKKFSWFFVLCALGFGADLLAAEKQYVLTVKGGFADGAASVKLPAGETCEVEAYSSNENAVFDRWTISPATADLGDFNARSEINTVEMPAVNVTLTANFITSPVEVFVEVYPEEAVEFIQWSVDGKNWNFPGGDILKAGKYTMTFRSLDPHWLAPGKQSIKVAENDCSGGYFYAYAEAVDVILARAEGPGAVTLSPTSGQLLPGKTVTLTAKPAKGAVFAGWILEGEEVPEFSTGFKALTPSLKIDYSGENEGLEYVAVFRASSACEAPVISVVPCGGISAPMAGVNYNLSFAVNASALPVKYTAKNLPAGLKIDSVTGRITGVPAKAQSAPVTVTVASVANPKQVDTMSFTLGVLPLPAASAGTYNGYLASEAGTLYGTFTFTASATGKLTCKASIDGAGTLVWKSAYWSSYEILDDGAVRLYAAPSEIPGIAFYLALDMSAEAGPYELTGSLDFFNSTNPCGAESFYTVVAQRNPFAATKKDANYDSIMATLGNYLNTYAFRIAVSENLEISEVVPMGYGYLSAAVSKTGSVKITGKMPDGTAVSITAPLILLDGGESACLPYGTLFSNGKKGDLFGMLQLNAASDEADGFARWYYPGTSDKISIPDEFWVNVDMLGRKYVKDVDLRTYNESFFEIGTFELTGIEDDFMAPEGVELISDAKGSTLKPAFAGKAPKYNKLDEAYEYSEENPGMVTFSLTKATGLFKGKFNAYTEYYDVRDTLKLKTASISHEGIFIPGLGGFGFYLMTDMYYDESTGKAYSFKRSFPVRIEDCCSGF